MVEANQDKNKEIKKARGKFGLFDEILQLSFADTWNEAKKEWRYLGSSYNKEDFSYCLCGHPIKEECHMQNTITKARTIIGNCCVKLFNEEASEVHKTVSKTKINQAVIDYALKQNVLNGKEYDFMTNVWRKRKRSYKQQQWYNSLKRKVLREFSIETPEL